MDHNERMSIALDLLSDDQLAPSSTSFPANELNRTAAVDTSMPLGSSTSIQDPFSLTEDTLVKTLVGLGVEVSYFLPMNILIC